MKSQSHLRRLVGRQGGAALVVSLLLLLVMTLLGLGASQSTRLQERMAGNQRDQEVALQAAEAALRGAEQILSPEREFLNLCENPGASCDAYMERTFVTPDGTALDLASQADSWWERWGKEYEFADQLEEVATPPELVIEYYDRVRDVKTRGNPAANIEREFYTVTARSTGQSDTAKAVVQSSYSRIVFR